MRASQLVCGSLLVAALFAAACGDDAPRGTEAGAGDAGDGNGAAAGSESSSGGSESDPARAGSDAGGNEPSAGTGAGGQEACPAGPEGEPPDDYLAEFQSGSRLEARYFAANGMPNVFAGFFDTELGDWCDFVIASDDQLRCLPRSTPITHVLGSADAACQNDVVVLSPGCATGQPHLRERAECADKAQVRALLSFDGVPFDTACMPEQAPAPANSYAVSDEVPPESFVAGELLDLPGVCRAGLRLVEAVDGARGPFQIFDIASGTGCQRGSGCRPERLAFEDPTLTTDDACETPADPGYATWSDPESCGPPDFVRPADPLVDGWYRAGPISDAELYAAPGGGCEPAREKGWIGSIYELGELIPSGELAAPTTVTLGTGALQVRASSEAGTPLLALIDQDVRFHHAALAVDCNLRPFADGTWRCIPTDIVSPFGIYDEYNDADCTVPTRRCVGDDCPGKVVFDESPDPQCSSDRVTTAVWRYSEPATAYYRESPGSPCYPAGAASPDMWLVEAVDPSDLPEATLEVAD